MLATQTREKQGRDTYAEPPKKINKFFITTIIVLILFFLTGLFSTVFAFINMSSEKIIPGVSIRGISVAGLDKFEAQKKLEEILKTELEKDIILQYQSFTTSINPKLIDFNYDINKAIEQAFEIGRADNLIENNYKIIGTFINNIDLKLSYTYNSEILNEFMLSIDPQLPDAVEQSTYYIEDGKIILFPGKAGNCSKKDELTDKIIETIIDEYNIEKKVQIPVETVEPYQIDVDKFHELLYVEPKNAYYTNDPFAVYQEVIGVDFNAEEVKKMLQEKQDQYIIDLNYTIPEITKNDIGLEAFPDLLATFSTRYDASNKNRTTNLKLASDKINGVVLLPGEEFSYNNTVGERTVDAGYKDAKIYLDGQVVDGLGGGICQISSTLYNAVLHADLQVIDRRNHQFVTSYLKAGLDATVVYGSQDFKFKNSRNYPIKIVSEVSGGVAKIQIFGIREEVEYDIKVEPVITQSNSTSIKSVTYKYKYLDGNLVDKITISKDTYKRH